MAHIILTGSTGTAGSAVLAQCIRSPSISQISILSRRPVQQAQGCPKTNVIIHNDFTAYPSGVLQQLKGAAGCVWALGVPAGQVSASEYKTITYDYPIAAAKTFATLSPSFNFVHVSGEGATRDPGRFTQLFARTKGHAESELLSLMSESPSLRVYNVRPGFIDDSGAKLKEGKKSFMYALADRLAPALKILYPSGHSPTGNLAEVLVRCVEETGGPEEVKKMMMGKGITWEGEGDGVGVLIENVGMRRLAGL